jgi:transposase InsO family protein
MDFVKFAKYNDGYRYILVVIDVFSKYWWLRKLKDKKGESVAKAFETIFKEGRKPYKMRTDKGQEFRARAVQSVFKEAGIKHFYAQNEVKASVAERVIKTIKTKIYRYFTFKQSYRYIDKLQSFAEGYNHTIHSTIDMEPAKVTKGNEELVRLSTYLAKSNDDKGVKKFTFKFKIGDKVHITQLRSIFSRRRIR